MQMVRIVHVVASLFALSTVTLAAQESKKQDVAPPPKPPAGTSDIAAPVDPKTYIIGAEDVLYVHVWREAELTRQVAVRPDGKVTLPLAGDVQAGGLTPEAFKKAVVEAYSKFVNQPEITVSVLSVLSKKYYIVGMANRTGSFALVVPTTVLEALNGAGGLQEFANKKKIVILRGSKRIRFNYSEVIAGKNLQQNILLENGDHIIVP